MPRSKRPRRERTGLAENSAIHPLARTKSVRVTLTSGFVQRNRGRLGTRTWYC